MEQKHKGKMEKKSADLNPDLLHKEIGEAIIKGLLSVSPEIDKFSTWFLAGAAASIALVITNLTSITPAIHQTTIKNILFLLIISILFGLLQKYISLGFSINQKLEKYTNDKLELIRNKIAKEIGSNEEKEVDNYISKNLDIIKTYAYLASAFPVCLQKFFINALAENRKERKEALSKHRKNVSSIIRQFVYVSLQLVFGIISLMVIIISI